MTCLGLATRTPSFSVVLAPATLVPLVCWCNYVGVITGNVAHYPRTFMMELLRVANLLHDFPCADDCLVICQLLNLKIVQVIFISKGHIATLCNYNLIDN